MVYCTVFFGRKIYLVGQKMHWRGAVAVITAVLTLNGCDQHENSLTRAVTLSGNPNGLIHPDVKGNLLHMRGMRNLGNTCYFNAQWQVLAHNALFKAYVASLPVLEGESVDSGIVRLTKAFLREHWSIETAKWVDPTDLMSAYRLRNSFFTPGPQNDAIEALEHTRHILDSSSVATGGAPLTLFHFSLRSRISCEDASQNRHSDEAADDLRLSLEASDDVLQLDDLIKDYFVKEYLEDFRCGATGNVEGIRGGWRQLELASLPQLLVIQLKRFRPRPGQPAEIIRTRVEFPEVLDVSSVPGAPVESRFKLTGVVRHMGKDNSGHFIADYFHPELEQWVRADDTTTKIIKSTPNQSRTAYILFYERLNDAHSP